MPNNIWTERQPNSNFASTVAAPMSQNDDPGEIKKRSVILDGHRTSVSLENAFWSDLKKIAAGRGITVNQLVTEIDRDHSGNLSSAIRVFVLQHYRQAYPLG